MQQIWSVGKNKKTSQGEGLLIYKSNMVRLVDYRWNQLYPSLILMHEKLVKLGLNYHAGKVIITEVAYPDVSK